MTQRVLRRARQTDEKLERRRQILAAAEALFVEGRAELPTVQAIADCAGVAKSTLYLYFATVEDVFIALVGEHTARAMSDAQERLRRSRPPLTPYEHISKCWQKEPERFRLNPHHHTLGLNI